MTELERYKKAYATLVGRVDETILAIGEFTGPMAMGNVLLTLSGASLIKALREAEEIMISGNSEEDNILEADDAPEEENT